MADKKIITKNGFSFIETMVSISLLMLIMVGPISLSARGVSMITEAKNRLIAFYLAQEAIEHVRMVRDNNSYSGASDWIDGVSQCVADAPCGVDVFDNTDNGVRDCSYYNGCIVKFDSITNRYGHIAGSNSIFIRTVVVSKTVSFDDEAEINVEVSWNSRYGGLKKVNLVENVLNWK